MHGLQRRLGLPHATALNMTNMIGMGPFITIPALMSALNGPRSMLGWLVAVVITLPDALVWSELGAAMPGSGGSYVYLREAFGGVGRTFGRLMTFLFVWQFVMSGPLEIASAYIGIAQYLSYLWPGLSSLHIKLIVVAAGVLAIALLYRKITSIGRITIALWIGTMIAVLWVIASGLPHFDPKVVFDTGGADMKFTVGFVWGLGAAARIGVYDFLGYYDVCYLGDEIRDPGRVIPRSIIISIAGVALIYVLMNLSIISVVPWRQFVPATDPPAPVASMFMEKLYGHKVATGFTAMVLWTAFASVFALLLGYSRIPYAAAKDGNFFRVFAHLHPAKDFPDRSLLLVGVLSIACSFLPLLTVIDALLVTRFVIQFISQCVAVILLRRHRPQMDRPYKVWLYPLPPLLALCGWAFLFVTAGVKLQAYAALVVMAGVVFFLIWNPRNKRLVA